MVPNQHSPPILKTDEPRLRRENMENIAYCCFQTEDLKAAPIQFWSPKVLPVHRSARTITSVQLLHDYVFVRHRLYGSRAAAGSSEALQEPKESFEKMVCMHATKVSARQGLLEASFKGVSLYQGKICSQHLLCGHVKSPNALKKEKGLHEVSRAQLHSTSFAGLFPKDKQTRRSLPQLLPQPPLRPLFAGHDPNG